MCFICLAPEVAISGGCDWCYYAINGRLHGSDSKRYQKSTGLFYRQPNRLYVSGAGCRVPGVVAIFHLMTHAFFKALLFLTAGSIILAMHHEQDIFKMGGLRKDLRLVTCTISDWHIRLGCFPGLFRLLQ